MHGEIRALPDLYWGEVVPRVSDHVSVKASDLPNVSGRMRAEVRASIHTMAPVRARPVVRLTLNVCSMNWCNGISSTSAPRIKLVTVAATVTRRLVPKCSAVEVTKTER